MKLLFTTANPDDFKSEIISLIENGELQTWEILENEGVKYLKHTKQWGEKGVIKLITDIENDNLIVKVVKYKGIEENVKDFEGYYLGRFCEIIFVNFSDKFTLIEKK